MKIYNKRCKTNIRTVKDENGLKHSFRFRFYRATF